MKPSAHPSPWGLVVDPLWGELDPVGRAIQDVHNHMKLGGGFGVVGATGSIGLGEQGMEPDHGGVQGQKLSEGSQEFGCHPRRWPKGTDGFLSQVAK